MNEASPHETEPQMPNLRDMAREHFNEPMISFGKLVRCIGYAETAIDCYLIVKDQAGEEHWNTCVGGYTFLDALKGKNPVKSHDGEDWDDLTRLERELPPREPEFKMVLNFDDWEGFPKRPDPEDGGILVYDAVGPDDGTAIDQEEGETNEQYEARAIKLLFPRS